MSGIFVTGSGTDVGKTFVTAGLIRHLRRTGRSVDAYKPVASGFDSSRAEASDPGALLAALGLPISATEIERICPWRFTAALSPDMAARREGRAVDFPALVDFSRRAARAPGTVFIEGVGGVMVPLDEHHTVLDWMTLLRLPVLVVGGSYLGTLSHTLTALHVLAQRKLDIVAVAISQTFASAVSLSETVDTLARFVEPIPVVGIPRLGPGDGDHTAFAELAAILKRSI